MQEGDDVEVPGMRKYVQARLWNWAHDLQHEENYHSQQQQTQLGGTPLEGGSRKLSERVLSIARLKLMFIFCAQHPLMLR